MHAPPTPAPKPAAEKPKISNIPAATKAPPAKVQEETEEDDEEGEEEGDEEEEAGHDHVAHPHSHEHAHPKKPAGGMCLITAH